MGNTASEHTHQGRFFRQENFSNDPSAFRVFVKKKNKFIHGWLKVNDDEIMFMRGSNRFQCWSLAHLRRYGYTCSGVFFFESGRRCATGEGLHTFQTHQAERIFHMVQSKIKIEEYARFSRIGSVGMAPARVNSLVPAPAAPQRIHPVQRFSSEGAPSPCNVPNTTVPTAPPPYSAVFQDARRKQNNASPNCPSVISAVSTTAVGACCSSMRGERPRSVVSNIEHGTAIQHHNGRPIRPHPVQGNASSSTLLQHMMMQQQQQLQQGGYVLQKLPQYMQHSLAVSGSGGLMDSSFHSVLDASGEGSSPWASQQQLEKGEIVMEYVLDGEDYCGGSAKGRRRLFGARRPSQQISTGQPEVHQQSLVRVPIPPPPAGCKNHQSCACSTTSSSFTEGEGGGAPPPPPPPRDHQKRGPAATHAYVNVDLGTSCANVAQLPPSTASAALSVRELQQKNLGGPERTRRLEFLSTGPGAFQLAMSQNQMYTTNNNGVLLYPSASSNSPSAFSPTPVALMQHSFYGFYPQNNSSGTSTQHQQQLLPSSFSSSSTLSPYRQQQQQQSGGWQHQLQENATNQQRLMSQSISGALPPSCATTRCVDNGSVLMNNGCRQNEGLKSSLLYSATSNSLEQIPPKGSNGVGRTVGQPLPLRHYSSQQPNDCALGASRQQLLQPDNTGGGGSSSCSTLITSSTNTMATNGTDI